MWRILHKHRPWPIGLAIAADGVRMLQLKPVGSRLAVVAGAQWLRGQGDVGLLEALDEARREGNFEGRHVVSSISSDEVHIRSIRLPEMSQDELHAAISAKAQDLFGFDIALSQIQILGSVPVLNGDKSTRETILLALPNFALHRRRELLAKVALRDVATEAELVAMFRGFYRLLRRESDRMSINALVDVGPGSTMVLVAQGPDIIFVKKIDRGGEHLTKAAAEQLGLNITDAQELRQQLKIDLLERTRDMGQVQPVPQSRNNGSEFFWSVYDAVRSEADALVLEIGLCLRYCSTTFGCQAISKITLAGQEAWDPSLLHLLAERLGVRCEVAQPFRYLDVSGSRIFRDRRGMLADWTACVGLASWGQSDGHTETPSSPGLLHEGVR